MRWYRGRQHVQSPRGRGGAEELPDRANRGRGGVVLASGSNGGTATLSDDFSNYDVIKVASTSGIHSSFVELVAPLETNTNYMMFSTGGVMAYVRFTGKRTMTGVYGSYFVIGYKYQTA